MAALQLGGWQESVEPGSETLLQLLCFNSEEVSQLLLPGPQLHVSSMSTVRILVSIPTYGRFHPGWRMTLSN